MKLTKYDYINILEYYNIKINKNLSFSSLKKIVEKIIAEKLCSCVKKVPNENQYESRAIGICNYSVVKRKNLKINGFTCKKKKMLKTAKFNKNRLTKTIRNKLSLIVKRKSSKRKSSKK
jgi:hypothetical protein